MKINFSKKIIILLVFLIFFFIGSVAAVDNETADGSISIQTNNTDTVGTIVTNNSNITNNTSKVNNTTVPPKTVVNTNTVPSKPSSGCCSVLVHYKSGWDVFSYRRDSNYAANLYIQKVSWYGKQAIKEYKTVNGYFFHTIVSKNGWIVGTGGPDIPWINRELEKIAGQMSVKGRISSADMNRAYKLIRRAGMGHFLIKAPNDYVGLAIYNSGRSRVNIFKMRNGEYVSVPNSPKYYRRGFISKKVHPVSAALWLAATDKWGVNRRNIMTYQVKNTPNSTDINIWASYDNGKLIYRRSRGNPDNIIFLGKKVYAKTIPKIPYKKYIGSVSFKSTNTLSLAPQPVSTAKT